MRKFYIVGLVFCIFLLSGCGLFFSIDVPLKNMNNLKNFTVRIENKHGEDFSSSIIQVDNDISKREDFISSNGSSYNSVIYTENNGDFATSYYKGVFGDSWIISKDKVRSVSNYIPTEILSFSSKMFKRVDFFPKDGVYKFKVDGFSLGLSAEYYIYATKDYITRLEIFYNDSSEIITFSDFNSTSVVIPDEVKASAKNFSDIDLFDVSMPDVELYDDVLKDEYDKVREYMNSDEYKSRIDGAKVNIDEYIDQDLLDKQIEDAKSYIDSFDYRNKIEHVRERINNSFDN